ncbi:hypothetical protein K439DRAFT_1645895 [Ramaria rubella]|nr:hypothetical protein K439DRAFT_1645895 [Ramaria rubella]
MAKLQTYASSLPYSIEPNSKMQLLLDFYLMRFVQCVKARDYDPGLLQWDSMIDNWFMLKYPIPLAKRIRLAKLYYELCVTPGMPGYLVSTWADGLGALIRSKKKLRIEDMRMPWKPIYDILRKELFLTRRQFEISQIPYYMGYIAELSSRFFHPAAIDEMLETFLPQFNGTSLNMVLATQYYLVTFLPLSHPQSYLPLLFRIWESINSYMWDERMLSFLSQLAEMHVDPTVSDPKRIGHIPDDAVSEGEGRPLWDRSDIEAIEPWTGLWKDVGIFTNVQWDTIMAKCLTSMEIPLADSGSLTTGSSVDGQAGFEIGRLPKPTWRIYSLAKIIVYSMSVDGPVSPSSGETTPPDAPYLRTTSSDPGRIRSDVADTSTRSNINTKTYLAGSRALDSLSRLIISTESFFHPSNSGTWTTDLTAFIKYLVAEFNKRWLNRILSRCLFELTHFWSGWHEEKKLDCRTPQHRRLTPLMRRELVRCLRTPALLATFSRDTTTVSNIQSCFKSMSTMEPDLILHPILERAVPSLEALVETHRTTAVIKALGAVALTLVSRDIYYPGSKHLLPILELLLPGIDLNDPTKTLCTTAFLIEISQSIKFGDLTQNDSVDSRVRSSAPSPSDTFVPNLPELVVDELPHGVEPGELPRLSKSEEDVLLRESTRGFPDWVASFIRRVILLFENLPEDTGGEVRSGGESDIVDAVTAACNQICTHLSEPLFDLALNLIYDYASTTVRPNCVHAVHQLVECISNANPVKTLQKFLPLCIKNIQTELHNGASSVRTTSMTSAPLPSDATFHWTLAILRGLVAHKQQILDLFRLLHRRTFSKRGFSRASKLLSTVMLTLTHTYPTENRFVNPPVWFSDDCINPKRLRFAPSYRHRALHSKISFKVTWHTPSEEEITFALDILKQIVKPTLDSLKQLLDEEVTDQALWRNDFCRHLSFIRNAFGGMPTFAKEVISAEAMMESFETSDIINEIPEFIATVEPVASGFALLEGDPRHQFVMELRQQFGDFLKRAGQYLRSKGPENTLDAAHMLLRCIRTFMLDYGDSKDNFYTQRDRYDSEVGLARQYANQKIWPRALYVRKARLHHSGRLRWNSIERLRSHLHDALIDEVTQCTSNKSSPPRGFEWSTCQLPLTLRQIITVSLQAYDGVRKRVFPLLYKALVPGAPDHQVKGALWQINTPAFAKYAMTEPTLTVPFAKALFSCQMYEKPSIQNCITIIAENCLAHFVEPSFLVYSLSSPTLNQAVSELEAILPNHLVDDDLIKNGIANTKRRVCLQKSCIEELTRVLIDIAQNPQTHWRYSIVAIRCLRTLVRREQPTYGPQLGYFLEKARDTNPTMRYYALRSIMKTLRYIKLRTSCGSDLKSLALGINRNPLQKLLPVINPSEDYTISVLQSFKDVMQNHHVDDGPLFKDRMTVGWLVWGATDERYLAPSPDKSTFQPWEPESAEAVSIVRTVCCEVEYWKSIATYFAEETSQETLTMDNISATNVQPVIEELLDDSDQNKQRAAAELLAGVIGGSKHWTQEAQRRLWAWVTPLIPKTLGSNVKPDTLTIWTSFLEYLSWHKDPRRLSPLVQYVLEQFDSMDCNSESSFNAVKIASFHRGIAEEFGWKFSAWTDTSIRRYWGEIGSEHDEVRSYIADALELSGKIKWRPKPTVPVASCLVREARTQPLDFDLLGVRGTYHISRILELVDRFPIWREERVPGPRAFDSTYDRVGILVCKWLFQAIHDVQAISTFDYILPLMPELFRFGEVNDNDELLSRSSLLLVRMCGVTPPPSLIRPLLNHIFDAITKSPSYKTRLNALPLLQIWYFRQGGSILADEQMVVSSSLDDEKIEVREMAATTLAGILRSSPRDPILMLKNRFVRLSSMRLPPRHAPDYVESLRKLHGAILGICALIDAFPYTVESWTPELLTQVLAEHVYDPLPIAATVRKCASNFKKSHIDTWHEDITRFDEEQLSTLSTMLSGNSYYA